VVVDVLTGIEIQRPRDEVSAFVADPENAPASYKNIKAIEWQTPPPAIFGSKIRFWAQFLGRTLDYTYEVRQLQPGRHLVMASAQGRFPMETAYTWEDAADDATKMTLRNRGAVGLRCSHAPVMTRAMRKANEAELRRLKVLLEHRRSQPAQA
jgi:uncharacterized membrane protein